MNNPLRYQAPHVSHPIPPELDTAFRDFVGRGVTAADQEGIHTSPDSMIALTYAQGSDYGVVFSLDVRGLKPELEFEQIVLKRMFLREFKLLRRLVDDLQSMGTEDPEQLLEEVAMAYEAAGDVNPSNPFLRIANGAALFMRFLQEGPTDDILFQLSGCKRYLTDIDFDRVVEVELVAQPDNLRSEDQITSIYRNDELQKVAQVEYHGTSLQYALEAFPQLQQYLPENLGGDRLRCSKINSKINGD
jgi:hypothetical protein